MRTSAGRLTCLDATKIFNTKLTNDKEKKIPRGSWKSRTQPCHGLKELIEANEEAYRRSYDARRPLFRQLGEALQTVHKFAPVFDVMVQQQSMAVLVWGPMRFVIQVSSTGTGTGRACPLNLHDVNIPNIDTSTGTGELLRPIYPCFPREPSR